MKRRIGSICIIVFVFAVAAGATVILRRSYAGTGTESISILEEPTENVTYLTDIQYQEMDTDNCYLDVAYLDDRKKKPLLLFVHGGSWIGGNKEEMNAFLYTFSEMGYTVASIDYDLLYLPGALQGRCVSIAEEEACVAAAAEYLTEHAEEYQIDTSRVILIGHSSGGQLAGRLAERIADHPEDYEFQLGGVVLLAAPSDLRYYLYNNSYIEGLDFSLVKLSFIFDGVYGTDVLPEINKVDVLYNITENLPPVLILHGSDDALVPVSLSQNLYVELQSKGVIAELELIQGAGHNILDNEEVFSELNRFLEQYILDDKEE